MKSDILCERLVTKQLSYIGKTIEDAKEVPFWFSDWSIPQKDFDEFEAWALVEIKKTLKCSKQEAKREFDWFNLQYGLRCV